MTDMLYAFLVRPWSGLIIAALVAVPGWLVARAAVARGRRRARFIGLAIGLLAVVMAAGSLVTALRVARVKAAYPPPGRLIDVNGQRMHLLAEGEARGGPTLVWIPGGHASGFAFYGHHRRLRAEARSILFDRFGSGWSDAGPFPRRTAREAQELATMLDRAGEHGPFILIGHSYGGLLALNYARRFPDRVAALVLLDALQPDMVTYNRYVDGDGFGTVARFNLQQGVLKIFGIRYDPFEALASEDPRIKRLERLQDEYMGDLRAPLEAIDDLPAANWATVSIYEEFEPQRISQEALEWLVYDGELGDMPVWIVIPRDEIAALLEQFKGSPARQRALRLFQRMQERYMKLSSRTRLLYAPAGTSHNFPYEAPDSVTAIVRDALRVSRP